MKHTPPLPPLPKDWTAQPVSSRTHTFAIFATAQPADPFVLVRQEHPLSREIWHGIQSRGAAQAMIDFIEAFEDALNTMYTVAKTPTASTSLQPLQKPNHEN